MNRATLVMGLFCAASMFAQTPITFQYAYDDTGQLIKVVDSTGIAIDYFYDAVGNMLAIKPAR
jgi:Rhs family protein